jgi:hypothetical protein
MRIYYIFYVKEEIYDVTKNNPLRLYEALEKVHVMSNSNLPLSIKTYEKLVNPIDKKNIDLLIKNINEDNMNYMCFNNTHVINDFYTSENTKLILNNTYMKLKSNATFPSFLKDIRKIPNLFVCDFVNMDYFYLNEISSKSCVTV